MLCEHCGEVVGGGRGAKQAGLHMKKKNTEKEGKREVERKRGKKEMG